MSAHRMDSIKQAAAKIRSKVKGTAPATETQTTGRAGLGLCPACGLVGAPTIDGVIQPHEDKIRERQCLGTRAPVAIAAPAVEAAAPVKAPRKRKAPAVVSTDAPIAATVRDVTPAGYGPIAPVFTGDDRQPKRRAALARGKARDAAEIQAAADEARHPGTVTADQAAPRVKVTNAIALNKAPRKRQAAAPVAPTVEAPTDDDDAPIAPVVIEPAPLPPKERKRKAPAARVEDQRLPPPGTKLSATVKGAEIVVEVTDAGFLYDGKSYRSLSTIGKLVCGYPVNGYRMFHLGEHAARPRVARAAATAEVVSAIAVQALDVIREALATSASGPVEALDQAADASKRLARAFRDLATLRRRADA